jgi:serine protease Do
VKAVRKYSGAVVNIISTKMVTVRQSLFGFEELFDDIFDHPFQREYKQTSAGSGFLVHESGYIVTNAHVVFRAAELEVLSSDGKRRTARIVSEDPRHDLALLKIEAEGDLPFVPLGRSDDLMVGETVIAIGNPLGYQNSVSTGVVSATGRDLRFRNDVVYRNLIQTDAAINRGNSGGPLLNIDGEVIGINTAIRGDAQNLGFAIPVEDLKRRLPRLLDVPALRHADLGLRLGRAREATWREDGRDRRSTGLEVLSVARGSAGADAGVLAGDLIVSSGSSSVSNVADLFVGLRDHPPNEDWKLGIARHGSLERAAVKLSELHTTNGTRLAWDRLGVQLKPISSQLARRLGVARDDGLQVIGVDLNGPAYGAGVRDDDIIFQIQDEPVGSLEKAGDILREVRAGEEIHLEIVRSRPGVMIRKVVSLTAR